ncbi:O-methyltransferase domain-containing protein [Mycolicibacterium aurum]|uniref:O-methyltransferase domain-containing protein n=1 Tax=Mycolicibacterium aurum TaxID=1791 RepID=A0A3S4VNT1_MYCAU|nr:class I SAM-dependent methyltransferase [Mycolicibacterium aurum]VEG55455.1 O-methyltransferase domain-containing protein [Mycolicibacterium aurum]
MDVSGLTAIESTALLTEYCRAVDARSSRAILADPLAGATVGQLDYDFAGLGATPSVVALVALRAKMIDERIAAFVAEHPGGVVVDIGAGFSSAVFRVDPPASVQWFSVDLPAVIALREALLPSRDGAHSLAATVLEPSWVGAIPGDRPAMVFADGLFAFLDEEAVIAILRTITSHFVSGVIAFNDYGRVSKANQFIGRLTTSRTANSPHRQWNFPGFKDARQPESWNSDLRLVDEASAMHRPEAALFPRGLRIAGRLSHRVPSVARKARVLQYRF